MVSIAWPESWPEFLVGIPASDPERRLALHDVAEEDHADVGVRLEFRARGLVKLDIAHEDSLSREGVVERARHFHDGSRDGALSAARLLFAESKGAMGLTVEQPDGTRITFTRDPR